MANEHDYDKTVLHFGESMQAPHALAPFALQHAIDWLVRDGALEL